MNECKHERCKRDNNHDRISKWCFKHHLQVDCRPRGNWHAFGTDFSSLQQSIKRAVLQALDVFQLARIVEVILSGQPSKTIRNRKQQVNSMAIADFTHTHTHTHELCPKTVGSPSNCWGAFLHSSSHCSTAWHAACWLTQHLSGLGFGVFPGQTKVLKDFGLGGFCSFHN